MVQSLDGGTKTGGNMQGGESRTEKSLENAVAVSLCIDIRSSRRQRGYFGITCHHIDSAGVLQINLLACSRFTGSHTADAILDLTLEVIQAYGIQDKILFVGTNNAAKIILAFEDWIPGFREATEQKRKPFRLGIFRRKKGGCQLLVISDF